MNFGEIIDMNWYKKASMENIDVSNFNTDSKWIPVDSSFIASVAYYKPLKKFEIRFKNGQEYSYNGVPSIVYKNFMKAKSKGEYFNRVIRKRYIPE
jgi:hypothetical protein